MIQTINFILGNRCLSECGHCFAQSTPHDKLKLGINDALSFVDEINSYSEVKNIWFNGGEPFLYLSEMVQIISTIRQKPGQLIKISTGAQPFKSLEATRRILNRLPRVDRIYASIDVYHLLKSPISNYQNLSKICDELSISLIFSISFANLKDLGTVLKLIHESSLKYESITKQPIFRFGNANKLDSILHEYSSDIPPDYKCGEIGAVTIWPDGAITTCSAYAGRSGKTPRFRSLKELIASSAKDEFYLSRCNQTLLEIAKKYKVDGHFDVTSPCATCKSIIHGIERKNGGQAC